MYVTLVKGKLTFNNESELLKDIADDETNIVEVENEEQEGLYIIFGRLYFIGNDEDKKVIVAFQQRNIVMAELQEIDQKHGGRLLRDITIEFSKKCDDDFIQDSIRKVKALRQFAMQKEIESLRANAELLLQTLESDDCVIDKIKDAEDRAVILRRRLQEANEILNPLEKAYFIPRSAPPVDDSLVLGQTYALIDEQLAKLTSVRMVERGKKDPEFEERRLQTIQYYLDIENQPGFPHEIEWGEVL